jgi:predicted transcriptional regulator
MKTRKFKVRIQSLEESGQDFIKAWKKAEKGEESEPRYDLILSFPDISWISKVLSPQRIKIIQMVRDKKPDSIRLLAKMLGRAQQNVQRDVQELSELGILDLKRVQKRGKKGESIQPEFNWSGFDIAV